MTSVTEEMIEREQIAWMTDKAWQDAVLMLVFYDRKAKQTWLVGADEAAKKRDEWWARCCALYDTRSVEDIAALEAALSAAQPTRPEPTEAEVEALTLADLRKANLDRQAHWGGSENWTLADWSNALAGEVGEACNVVKKLRRPMLGTVGNDHDPAAYTAMLATEIGDVLIYLDLLANAAGLDLAVCVTEAFNSKSEKLGMPVKLAASRSRPAEAKAGMVKPPEHLSPLPWKYERREALHHDWIEDAHGNVVVDHVGHIDGPFIVASANAALEPVAEAKAEPVAFRWRFDIEAIDGFDWKYASTKPEFTAFGEDHAEVQPLYTSPVRSEVTEAMVGKLRALNSVLIEDGYGDRDNLIPELDAAIAALTAALPNPPSGRGQ
ncbi:MazG nucleotide pyrophosphohydrolase domain-containing protein [Devosia sp. ZB163]|uniref:MazG nucleotide pyrophosphohydrolase domain-containing protein n=1 Tax=Devosia sp. ZB163 TaxID=3025938 RepID=UPI002360EF61|nr:MazG nucleotide pyrophosphohydrolase domain-containing protein [Devosia sp. ZB163]MDC9825637.1 MazG nucleotide pyrophosphohydrolase domain-containing protein [Devosia sp. ZB163]